MRTTVATILLLSLNSSYAESITQKFYNKFWEIDPNQDIQSMVLDPNYNKSFQEVVFKARTGYGTGNGSDFRGSSAYQNLVNSFASCVPSASDSGSGCPSSTTANNFKNIRIAIAKLEQCYANIPVDSKNQDSSDKSKNAEGLTFEGFQRSQTKLEKEMSLECMPDTALSVLKDANQYTGGAFNITVNSDSSASDIKQAMSSLHSLLVTKLQSARKEIIESINKNYLNGKGSKAIDDRSFIDKSEIDDSEVNEILNAYNDVVIIDSYLPPTGVFSRVANDSPNKSNVKILANGNIVTVGSIGGTDSQAEKISNLRNSQVKSFKDMLKQQTDLIESFGTLKQNAILNVSSLVAERTKQGDHSMLYSIENTINEQLKKSTDKDEVKPSLLLLQIRDAIRLNNKLTYMNYIAIERVQQSLSVTQIAQLKPLSDKINEITEQINKLSSEIDLGSALVENK